MIKVKDSVPSIYYDSSRDFQLIGHLFDLVLNAVKTEADILFSLPLSGNSPDQLLDLMAFTLGLRLDKSKYTARQLRAICSVAPQMMRNKGSLKAVQLLCNALMRADSVEGEAIIEVSENSTKLDIFIASASSCQDILYEILPYIVPAGIIFSVRQTTVSNKVSEDHVAMIDEITINEKVSSCSQLCDQKAADLARSPSIFYYEQDGTIKLIPGLINTGILVPLPEQGEKDK